MDKIDSIEDNKEEDGELKYIWDQLEYANENREHTNLKFAELQAQISQTRRRKLRRLSIAGSSVAAALVLFFLGYAVTVKNEDIAKSISFDSRETGVKVPKSNVTLSVDGNLIGLNSKSASAMTNDSGLSIVTEDGKMVKEITGHKNITIKVPVGHQFEMTLPDGTKVWLNSDSELIYPSSFEGATRQVKIVGEGYFDVKRDETKPFIVSVNGKYNVKVLGTKFNVDSYRDSEISRTTLVSGKVAVVLKGNNNEVQLSPSEQMTIDDMNCVEVETVNTESFTSWIEKRFVFDNEKLSDIAVKMKRCYGMEVFVNETYRDYRFSGRISYNRGIDYFIKVLKETEGIHCELKQGNLLIGMKK